jgi:hypothetical protein
MTNQVIILEFNELVPHLVDGFIAAGDLPNFARLRDRSLVAVTDAEESAPTLEPWIQWVTVHTGLPYGQHRVFHLNDGPKLEVPRIWDLASRAGRGVWICGSMNAATQTDFTGLVLPDPWATMIAPQPEGLFEPYLKLVRAFVQEYSTGSPKLHLRHMLAFARFMAMNGLSTRTIRDTIAQLATERFDGSQWKRAAILDRLQWDVFRAFWRRKRPALATFFLNSTAHYQHYFWRNMDPAAFAMKSDAATQARYADAIRFGYQCMDRILGECLDLAGNDVAIVLCTALSQQPMHDFDAVGGKQIFKPHDAKRLVAYAGVTENYAYDPVMAEQFFLTFDSPDAAARAAKLLSSLSVEGAGPLMHVEAIDEKLFCYGSARFAIAIRRALLSRRSGAQRNASSGRDVVDICARCSRGRGRSQGAFD